jgi:hypothetical protein
MVARIMVARRVDARCFFLLWYSLMPAALFCCGPPRACCVVLLCTTRRGVCRVGNLAPPVTQPAAVSSHTRARAVSEHTWARAWQPCAYRRSMQMRWVVQGLADGGGRWAGACG